MMADCRRQFGREEDYFSVRAVTEVRRLADYLTNDEA